MKDDFNEIPNEKPKISLWFKPAIGFNDEVNQDTDTSPDDIQLQRWHQRRLNDSLRF